MLKSKTVGIIGLGHMGQSLRKGLLKAGFDRVLTSNKAEDNLRVVDGSDLVFLTVRPDKAFEVLDQITSHLENKILISLVAGLSISLPDVSVFRLMTSILISENMGKNVAWGAQDVKSSTKQTVAELLDRLATTNWVKSEDEVDEATLTVGAGPGWMAKMIANLDKVMLRQVLDFIDVTGISAEKLAKMIGTPGGITNEMILAQNFQENLQLSFKRGGSKMGLIKKKYQKR